MGKEVSVKEKVSLVEECLSGRMRYREAALQGTERQKYSEAMKQKAVKEYIDGGGSLLSISEKYQISTPSLLLEWVQVYHRHNKFHTKEEESVMAVRGTLYIRALAKIK